MSNSQSQNPSGIRSRLENEMRLTIDAQLSRAFTVVWPETTVEEQALLDSLRAYLSSEAAPALAADAYRVMGIPLSCRRVMVRLEGNGLGFKGGNIEAKISTGDSEQNILDLRALRDQWVELCSTQQELTGEEGEQLDLTLPPARPAAPAPEPEPEFHDDEVPADIDIEGEETEPPQEAVRLYHVIDPEGNPRTTEPLSWIDADALMQQLSEELQYDLSDGASWRLQAVDNEPFPEDQHEPFPDDVEPEAVTVDVEPEPEVVEAVDDEPEAEEPTAVEVYSPEGDDAEEGQTEAQEIGQIPLTDAQQAAADALRNGSTLEVAARAADVSELTVKRWKKNVPGFAKACGEYVLTGWMGATLSPQEGDEMANNPRAEWFTAWTGKNGAAPYEQREVKESLITGVFHTIQIRHAETKEILMTVTERGYRKAWNFAHKWLYERLALDKAHGRPWAK